MLHLNSVRFAARDGLEILPKPLFTADEVIE